jgi:hypothetical protein
MFSHGHFLNHVDGGSILLKTIEHVGEPACETKPVCAHQFFAPFLAMPLFPGSTSSFDETGMRSSASNLAVLVVGFVEYSLHINSLLNMYKLSARGLGIETDFPH